MTYTNSDKTRKRDDDFMKKAGTWDRNHTILELHEKHKTEDSHYLRELSIIYGVSKEAIRRIVAKMKKRRLDKICS